MGIPLYGYHWYAGDPGKEEKPNPTAEYVNQPEIEGFIPAYHPKIEWDAVDRVSWFYFYRDDMREWIFFTDEHTFRERYELVRQHGLQGFCSWVLGQEDPSIWNVLPSHK